MWRLHFQYMIIHISQISVELPFMNFFSKFYNFLNPTQIYKWWHRAVVNNSKFHILIQFYDGANIFKSSFDGFDIFTI